jgi:hypothetical protein
MIKIAIKKSLSIPLCEGGGCTLIGFTPLLFKEDPTAGLKGRGEFAVKCRNLVKQS